MMKHLFVSSQLLVLISCLLGSTLMGCSSKLIVQSQPEGAEVFISAAGKGGSASVGTTPLEISESDISDKLQISPGQAGMVELTLKKDNHKTKSVLVPANRWGETTRLVNLTLEAGKDSIKDSQLMVQYLMNAQKLAQGRQFEQAILQLDKALTLDQRFPAALVMKGSIYYLQQQYAEAETWYKKALEVDPSTDEAIKMLERLKSLPQAGGRS